MIVVRAGFWRGEGGSTTCIYLHQGSWLKSITLEWPSCATRHIIWVGAFLLRVFSALFGILASGCVAAFSRNANGWNISRAGNQRSFHWLRYVRLCVVTSITCIAWQTRMANLLLKANKHCLSVETCPHVDTKQTRKIFRHCLPALSYFPSNK